MARQIIRDYTFVIFQRNKSTFYEKILVSNASILDSLIGISNLKIWDKPCCMHKLFHNRSITFGTIYTSPVSYLPERSFLKHKTPQTNDFKRSDHRFIKLK